MNKTEDDNDAEKMALYQITFNGSKYCYQDYSYDKLADAINYAKRNVLQQRIFCILQHATLRFFFRLRILNQWV